MKKLILQLNEHEYLELKSNIKRAGLKCEWLLANAWANYRHYVDFHRGVLPIIRCDNRPLGNEKLCAQIDR